MPELQVGKTYPLADGTGTGTVVKVRYLVRINRPGKRHHGEVGTYSPDGTYSGATVFETPALLVDEKARVIEEDAF